MKKCVKRIAAAVLAVVLAASLCGCDRGYIMTVDGMEIRNGIYLSYLDSAYSIAASKIRAQKAETSDETDDTDSTDDTPVTEEELEGKSGSQWIKDETMRAVRRFVAIQRKCGDVGVTLTDSELAEAYAEITDTWDTENSILQMYYGMNTMGEYYESQGIGQESLKEISRVNKLRDKLFMYYYGKDGEFEVTDAEIDEYLKENYASFKMKSIAYTDDAGKALEEDEDKKAVVDKAKAYAERINKGEKVIDVFYEYDLEKAENAAKAKAETDYKEDNEDKLTKDEWIKKQVEAANVTKAETEELDRVISKESSGLEEKLTEYIFNAADDGKATVYEAENTVYIIIREDITEKSKWKEDNNATVLDAMKGEDFDNMLDLFGQNYEVDADESLINKKYSPEKLN